MNTIFGATFVGRLFTEVLSANCSRENVGGEMFCSLRSHGTRDKAGSIIDRCYRERVSVEVFCSLRSHGTRFAYGRLRAQALSQPCLVKGRWRGVLSGDDKLTTANLCDRKKTAAVGAMML